MTDEEAIERLKQIKKDNDEIVEETKNLATEELTVSLHNDSIAIETVLNIIQKQQAKIEKKDTLYHKALHDLVISEHEHKHDIKMLDEVKGEAVKLYKMIDLMAKFIEEQTGSCPLDMFNYKEIDCENVCKQEMYPCWIEYFKRKVEDK